MAESIDENHTNHDEWGGNSQNSQRGSFLQTIQSLLAFVVGSAGVLTASGFIIVNIYLSRYTSIHIYDVIPTQYLVASVGALIFSLFLLLLLSAVGSLLIVIYVKYRIYRGDLGDISLTKFFQVLFSRDVMVHIKLRITHLLPTATLATIISVTLFSVSFGLLIYPRLPRSVGGGAPVVIGVVFKDSNAMTAFGFRPAASSLPNVVAVGLLAELSDGLLVMGFTQSMSYYVVVVKNDEIRGIIDIESMVNAGFFDNSGADATPVATPEVTATAQVTPAITP